jgi:hypothetical protein
MLSRAPRTPSVTLLCIILLAACGSDAGTDAPGETTPDASAVRGTWEVMVPTPDADGQFELRIGEPSATEEAGTWLAIGCMGRGEERLMAPAAVSLARQSPGVYTAVVTTTLELGPDGEDVSIAQLSGLIDLGAPGFDDDAAGGREAVIRLRDGESPGWSGIHVSLESKVCPPVDVSGSTLRVMHNLEAHLSIQEGEQSEGLFLVTETNIVSSGVLVTLPGAGTVLLEAGTDIFAPWVDFVEAFRFGQGMESPPAVGRPYRFVLLDAAGEPIAGTEWEDVFERCEVNPPGDLTLEVLEDGSVRVTWQAPPPAFGFDPLSGIGMYQVQVLGASGELVTGAETGQAEHILPWEDFGGEAPGVPDGATYGSGLEDLVPTS